MTNRSFLLYLALALTVIFTILQISAQFLYFYWIYWWFDWLMHFLAGLTGGLAAFWVLYYAWFWRSQPRKILLPVLTVLVVLLIVGGVWEVLEYVLGITDAHEEVYMVDVIHDLMADAAGALLAAFIGVKLTILNNND